MPHTVAQPPDNAEPFLRAAADLAVGDRIAAGFLPDGDPAEVVYVRPYTLRGQRWVFVVHVTADGLPEASYFYADGVIPLAALADDGMGYTRADTDADDPTPISPARVPLHTGGVVDGGQLVDETPVPELAYIAPTADGGMVYALKRDVVAEDETSAEPVHYRFGRHDTACGLKPGEVPAATADHAKVTCKACIDGLPF